MSPTLRTIRRRANQSASHLPDHLPRNDEILSPGSQCRACGGVLKTLGEDVTEELEYIPGRFVVEPDHPPGAGRVAAARRFANRRCRRALSRRGDRGRGCSHMCWPTSTRTIFRFIASRKSSSAKVSISTARPLPIGSASPPPCWSRWPMPSSAMCSAVRPFSRMILQSSCCHPVRKRQRPRGLWAYVRDQRPLGE